LRKEKTLMESTLNDYEVQLQKHLEAVEGRIAAAVSGGASNQPVEQISLHEVWAAGETPWGIVGEFARDRVVGLTQEDFAKGTIRVLVPCKLVLCESIQFNPNAPAPGAHGGIDRARSDDWFPKPDQAAYFASGVAPHPGTAGLVGAAPTLAYRLGFFAAITVEHGEGTIIDLNGFRLSCHPHFALQQRFHALIELANQPFIPDQGPANFGPELRAAGLVWVRNGQLGRSSHHGIHGNSMHDVLISDVTFRDFEVAAISLNGGRRIIIRDCQIEGTATQIPVLGSYSTGRFVRLIGRQRLARADAWLNDAASGGNPGRAAVHAARGALDSTLQALDAAMDDMFDHAMGNGNVAPPPIFHNVSGLADANPYGIAIHARGVLVNAFLCNGPAFGQVGDAARAYECSDVTIRRTNIANIRGAVREVLALAEQPPGNDDPRHGRPVADAAGSLFRFFGLRSAIAVSDGQPAEMDAAGRANLSPLGAAQIALADLEHKLVEAGALASHLQAAKIPPSVVAWASSGQQRIAAVPRRRNLYRILGQNQTRFTLQANGDSMFHVNKGAVGLFLQAVDGLTLDRVVVAGVRNSGYPGSDLPGAYSGPSDGGHTAQGRQLGYGGADARAVHVGACSHVLMRHVAASALASDFGSALAISIAGGSVAVDAKDLVIGDVSAGQGYENGGDALPTARLPNRAPEAIGLFVDRFSVNVSTQGIHSLGRIQSAWIDGVRMVRMESPPEPRA
jgi:hypothetical protein